MSPKDPIWSWKSADECRPTLTKRGPRALKFRALARLEDRKDNRIHDRHLGTRHLQPPNCL